MNAHILQHVPFEGIGSLAASLAQRDAAVTYTRFFASSRLPDLASVDLLIVMGGPMSVNEEGAYPWLRVEKQLICDAIAARVPVLGICLGAQLIASAAGSRVYPHDQTEIGWFPVRATDRGMSLGLPATSLVFHWHGETFDLPPGAQHLASSDACPNQAFMVNSRTMGVQFHPEATPETVEGLLQHCGDELAEAPSIQSAAEIRSLTAANWMASQRLLDRLLSQWLEKAT